MAMQNRENLLRELNEQLWNHGQVEIADDFYDRRASINDLNFPVDGVEGLKTQVREWRLAQPDFRVEIDNVVVDEREDEAHTCVYFTMSGTHRGDFAGIAGTGKTYVCTGMRLNRWTDGHIVEEHVIIDILSFLQQIEVIPQDSLPMALRFDAQQQQRRSTQPVRQQQSH